MSTKDLHHLQNLKDAFNKNWNEIIAEQYPTETRLHSACRYALAGEGKRVRPLLVLLWNQFCSGKLTDAFPLATAVEFVHTYSLVHDDLPCMDDDNLRRGRPTVHIQYDEHTAVLTGDALLSDAFGILAKKTYSPHINAKNIVAMVQVLSTAIGSDGMVQGQDWDMSNSNDKNGVDEVERIHHYKTGKLIEASCVLGAISAGAREKQIETASAFGRNLGLCFQIQDDLLDRTTQTGKSAGKDAAQNKTTFGTLLSAEDAEKKVRSLAENALASLEKENPFTPVMAAFVKQLMERMK
ncbi:MAG: polyprenyl synthetase family protein [Oligoflexales bacterium]